LARAPASTVSRKFNNRQAADLELGFQGSNMTARIYQPARTATQSGQAKDKWLLEYEPESPRQIEPLMGWTSSGDMKSQVKLKFDTKEEAIAYAQRNGIAFRVEDPKPVARRISSYSDNFRHNRVGAWTH
jgi:hypothetical protein